MRSNYFNLLVAFVATVVGPQAFSAPLTQAEVTRVYREVSLVDPAAGKRPAAIHDVVKGELGVETGVESRAELLFPDNTLTRLAANTYFSFKTGTREMDLSHGAILFQIPHGVGGAKINTAAITAAITGTTGFVERVGGTFKLVLLEGTVRVYLRDRIGESMIVHGGQMLIAPVKARTMKDWSTVDFDVDKMMKTSTLLKKDLFKPLPDEANKLITEVIENQKGNVKDGQLNPTNLVINGGVSTVMMVENDTRSRFDAQKVKSHNTPDPSPTASPSPSASPSPTASASPSASPSPTASASPSVSPSPTASASPSVSPSPTASASPSASPNPSPSATVVGAAPTPNPAPTVNLNPAPSATPPLIPSSGAYTIKANTVIDTTKASPSITTDGVTDAGMFFRDTPHSGSPSKFLFGTTSLFDNKLNFDAQFNTDFANSGVYKFSALQIQGNPSFLTRDGANSIALISQTDITSSAAGGTVNLNGLNELFLGTVSGSISLSDMFTFTKADGGAFRFIELYARNGSVDFGSFMNLKDANLTLTAEHNVTVDSTASILGNNVLLTGLGNTTIDGSIQSHFAQVYAGSNLTINGSLTADNLYGFANTGTINGSLSGHNVTLQIGGDLSITSAGSLSSSDKLTITTGGAMNLAGATTDLADATSTGRTYTLTAGTNINISGMLTASDKLIATGQNANISNTVTANNVNFTMSNGFNMTGAGTINGAVLNVSSGGGINLEAVNSTNAVTLNAGTNALLGNGTINFNGPVTTNNLNATGTTLTVNDKVKVQQATFNASQDFISNVGGDITANGGANGLAVNAGGLVTLNGQTAANNVTLTSGTNTKIPGAMTLNGPIQWQGNLTATGPTETVNAVLTGNNGTFASGTAFNLTSAGKLNLTGNGNITASNTMQLDGTTNVGGSLALNGAANIVANGAITSQDLTVAGTNDTFNAAISARHFTVTNQGDFVLAPTGSLTASDVVNIAAKNGIIFGGATSGKSFILSAGKDFTANATVQTPGSFSATSRNAYINQSLQADSATFNVANDFALASTGSMTTVHDINITSTNRDITLGAATNSNKLNLTALHGIVTMDGNAQAQTVSVSSKSATIDGAVTSASTANFALQQGFDLGASGSLTATGNIVISGQAITFDGSSSGSTYNLTGTGDLTVNGTLQAQDFQASAVNGTFNSSLTSAKGIALTLNGDFVTGASSSLSAVNNIGVTATGLAQMYGAENADKISVAATKDLVLNAGSNLQGATSVTLSGLTASIYGHINAPTVSITGTKGLLIDNANGFISADNIALNTPTGTLSLNGSAGASGIDLARLQSLSGTAQTVNLLSDFALPLGPSNLTVGSGGVNAAGFDLSGFNNITLNNSSYVGNSLSLNTLLVNSNGSLTLTGDLFAAVQATVPGSISVAGVLGGNKINAVKSIDAGTISAQNVTAGTVLTVGDGGVVPGSSGNVSLNAPTINWGDGGILMDGAAGTPGSLPGNASNLTLNTGSVAFDTTGTAIKSASLTGGDADPTRNDLGGNGGQLTVNATGAINVNAPIVATTGLNSKSGMTGGTGGNVNLASNSTITVNSKIETSSNDGNRRVSAKGGKITLNSKATNGTAIQIGSTAQLQALLSAAAPGPGGVVTFKSAGGAVNVNGSVTANRGTIDIENNGAAGKINLTNSTLSADVVKAGALGLNGVLTIGGGTISANTMLKLYAGGSNGLINFVSDVSLNGNSTKIISANTVTIQPTVMVTIGGPNAAQVYTNHPNYTGYGGVGKGYGTFGGAGAVTIKPTINNQPPGF